MPPLQWCFRQKRPGPESEAWEGCDLEQGAGYDDERDDDDGDSTMNRRRLFKAFQIFLFLLTNLLLLLPVVLLFLYVNVMTRGQSISVVVLFGAIFAVVLSSTPRVSFNGRLIGLSTYMAVLSTFLAQLSGPGCGV